MYAFFITIVWDLFCNHGDSTTSRDTFLHNQEGSQTLLRFSTPYSVYDLSWSSACGPWEEE